MKLDNDIKRRLAQACSRGTKQSSFINELLAGPVYSHWYTWGGGYAYGQRHLRWGATGLPTDSLGNLKRRLTAAGFTFKKEREPDGTFSMVMILPEMET